MDLQQKQTAFEERLCDLIRLYENVWIVKNTRILRKYTSGNSYDYDTIGLEYTDEGTGDWVWEQLPSDTQAELVEQWIQQTDSPLQAIAWNHQLDERVRSLIGQGDTAQAGEEINIALKAMAPDEIIDRLNALFDHAMGIEKEAA